MMLDVRACLCSLLQSCVEAQPGPEKLLALCMHCIADAAVTHAEGVRTLLVQFSFLRDGQHPGESISCACCSSFLTNTISAL